MRFALISEGITDQVVIEAIIAAYYKGADEKITVNSLQPMRDQTDQSRQAKDSHGGWKNVFEYISIDENCASALDVNDKIVIQIDSDICWDDSINIDPNLDQYLLFNKLKDLLISKIPPEVIEHLKDHLIFAIPVHSTECWLMPIYTKKAGVLQKFNNCEYHLKKINSKYTGKIEKTFECYEKLAAKIKNQSDIDLISKYNKSLCIFTQQLPKLKAKQDNDLDVDCK